MKKRQKIEFSDLKHLLFGGIGGTTLSPLTENFRAQNPFSGRFFSKQLLVVASRHSWRRFFQTIKVNIKSSVKIVLVMILKCDFLHFPFFNIFAPWSIVYTYPDDNTLSFQLYLYACIQTWHFGKYLPQKQMYKSVFHNLQYLYCNLVFIAHLGIYYTA